MAKAAQSKELRAAFVQHERETKGQVKRLDRVFKIIGKPARGKTCAAINGITEEGSDGLQGNARARCRPSRCGAGRGALRDFALRHLGYMGGRARLRGGSRTPRSH